MEQLEHRVIKLEFVTDTHDQELRELRDTSKQLSATLAGIQANLQQIKWMATGAAIVFIAAEMGILGVIKALVL